MRRRILTGDEARHPQETRDVLFFAMTGHRAAEIRELLKFAEVDSVTLPDECTNCGGVVMVRMTDVKRHRRFMTPGSWV